MDFSKLSREEKIAKIKELQSKKQAESAPIIGASPEEPSKLKQAAKGATGFAMGVAEGLNPLALPRAAETVVRAFGEDADPSKSLIGRVGERLEKASKKAVVPEFNVAQIASGTRTAFRKPFNWDKPIVELFNQEMKAQKDFESQLPENSKKAGEIITAVVSVGAAGKDIIKAASRAVPGGTKALEKGARTAAFQSIKPIGKAGKKLAADPQRVQAIGKQLLDDGIVTAGSSFKDILKKTKGKLDEYGEVIGHYAKSADDALARDSSVRGVLVDNVTNRVQNQVIPELIESGASDVAEQVSKWLSGNLKAAGPSGELSFKQAQKIKKVLDGTKAKFKASSDSVSHDAFQDVYRILNDEIETGIAQALTKAGSKEEIGQFMKAKDAYRNLKDAERFLEDTVGRMANNRMFSLTDYIAAVAAGGADGGVMQKGALSALMATANRAARMKGNQVTAATLSGLAAPITKQRAVPAIGAINALMRSQQERP